MSYNLLDEEWMPVLYRDGKVARVGIRKAFEDAAKIRQIASSNPMDRVAILRFLLALLYWCLGNPPKGGYSGDSFPPELLKKLDEHRGCFNLLGEGKRFYQDSTAQRRQAATQLIQEIPAGNNFLHFRHSTDREDGLCLSCCALGLLRLPLFSVSGLSGPGSPNLMAGINGVPPIYAVPLRASLMKSLLANWTYHQFLGKPSWETTNVALDQGANVPFLTGMTLLPRRVFLHDPAEGQHTCICCGVEKKQVILTCEYQTSGKEENDQWNDPHVVYEGEVKRKAMRADNLVKAGKFKMDRPWPDLLAHIAEAKTRTTLFIVGFATNKALSIDVWERTMSFQSSGAALLAAVGPSPKQWLEEGKKIEKKIGRSKFAGRAVTVSIRPHVENKVSSKAGELIAADEAAWEQAAREYSPMMAAVAKSLSPGCTTAALEKRNEIARIKPDMRPKKGGKTK